jgi:hypothetical protein
MDPFEGTEAEFNEDFGTSAPSDAELLELLALARASGNVPLRRLVHCYRTLRGVTADVVSVIEKRDGAVAIDANPMLGLAKSLTRAVRE